LANGRPPLPRVFAPAGGRSLGRTRDGRVTSARRSSDEGFTLIELLIVVTVMPLVVGALAVGILSVLNLNSSVSNRLTDSNDEQVLAANYQNDVQSAALITTASAPASAPAACGTGFQVLGLQLGNGTEVSYSAASTGATTSLSRNVCSGGNLTSSTVMAHDVPASVLNPATPPVTIQCTSTSTTCADVPPNNTPAYQSDWQPALGVIGVSFNTIEPASKFSYQLVATPLAAASSSQLAQVSSPSTGCGFATQGTGQDASTLCFVNFAPWNTQTGASVNNCSAAQTGFSTPIPMSAALASTPFTLDFCMSVKASLNSNGTSITGKNMAPVACGVAARSGYYDITASPLPTYACPPSSEAFLGNNGFYTGVPNDPALYEVDQGSTATINITNITLLSSNGDVASNWDLVTGDAESTDPGESITWSTDNTLVPFTLIPNSVNSNGVVTSDVGNACNSVPPAFDATHLTGIGTDTVECTTANSTDKTGTPMIEALEPGSLTVTLVGTGLQAMFMAILLP
jgi:prepilin-type N-terminal cleavage/methylation domain-containing protein